MEPPEPNSLKKQMGHNPPYRGGLYHQRISIVKLDASLKGFKKTLIILDP
jgi:hypothetical protein